MFGEGSLQAINQIIHQGGGVGGMFHIQVPVGAMFTQTRRIVGSARPERVPRNNTHRQGLEFDPLLTLQRWAEEMKILHGDFVVERVVKLTNHLLIAMLPAALEAQKQKAEEDAKQEAEKARDAEEESKRKAEEDERKKEDESDEEKANDAATTAQNSMQAPAVVIDDQGASSSSTARNIQQVQDTVMEGTIPSQPDRDSEMSDASEIESPVPPPQDGSPLIQALAQSSSTATPDRPERITVTIHGSAVDITDTGIDPTFLEALPDDMREEVLNQHVRDQQASRVERPPDSQISAEFLDALPPDIRAEIIQQEAVERARRRTEESTARPPVREAAEIDAASFIASLDPSLRQAVLLDQDDNFLQTLPSHMIAEAGVYRDEVQARRSHTSRNPIRPIPTAPPTKKNIPQHDAIMLLDRAGVAILVRLLFYPQVLKKTLLFKVLVNLCENMKTRTELFNLLLGILQDGTGDLDKSFSQMSVRSREHKLQPPKTSKQKSTDYVPAYGGFSQMEAVPDLIAQRCLESLTYIVNANDSSSLFFLTEHDSLVGLRKPSGKKGKGKEKQVSQTFYPLVLLLNLLDRQSLLRTPAILEFVVGLLATITRPLTSLKEQSKASDTVLPSISQSPSSGNVEVNSPSISPSGQQVSEDSFTEVVPGGKTTSYIFAL